MGVNTMRIFAAVGAALTICLGVASSATPSLAANPPPRVQGMNCVDAAAKVGHAKTWQALYWGWSENELDSRLNDQFLQAPCFTTLASCKAWLYWAQVDYPNAIQMQFCKQGQPYG
jgi:hypothetical protein